MSNFREYFDNTLNKYETSRYDRGEASWIENVAIELEYVRGRLESHHKIQKFSNKDSKKFQINNMNQLKKY